MIDYANDYTRLFSLIELDEATKKDILNNIVNGAPNSKNYTKKQVALFSAATLAVVAGVSYLVKNNKIR